MTRSLFVFKKVERILDQKISEHTLPCEKEVANKYGSEIEKTEHGFEKQT